MKSLLAHLKVRSGWGAEGAHRLFALYCCCVATQGQRLQLSRGGLAGGRPLPLGGTCRNVPVVDPSHVCDLLPSWRKIWVCLERLLTPDIWETNTWNDINVNKIRQTNLWKVKLCFFCHRITQASVNPLLFKHWTTSTAEKDYEHLLQLSHNKLELSTDNNCCFYICLHSWMQLVYFQVKHINQQKRQP